jgi:hypothetical protein
MKTNKEKKGGSIRAIHNPYSLPFDLFQETKKFKEWYAIGGNFDAMLSDLFQVHKVINKFVGYYYKRMNNAAIINKDRTIVVKDIIKVIGYTQSQTINYAAKTGMYLWMWKRETDEEIKDLLFKRFLWMRWIAYSNGQLNNAINKQQ